MSLKGLNLSDVITHVAQELKKAKDNANSEDAIMQFSGCEIELAVTVTAETGGGIKFWFVDANAKIEREKVSTVKLSFGSTGKILQFVQEGGGDAAGAPVPSRKKG